MAKMPTLRAKAKENHTINHGVPSQRQASGNMHISIGGFDMFFQMNESNRKAMNRNWSNQKANPALKTKTGYK